MSDNNNIDPTDPATLNFETMNASAKVVAHPQKPEPSNPSSPGTNFLSFSYYQKYFQVGQADVQRRLYKAFRIMDNDFLETEGSAPELWGPLWITLTLPVLLFISSMLSGKWAGSVHSGSLDYSLLTFGLFLFLFFATFEPLVMSYVIRRSFPTPNDPYMQYFEPIPLIMLTCYSWIILTVSFLLAIIPGRWWNIFVLYLSNTVSGTILWRNLSEILGKSTMTAQKALIMKLVYSTIHSMLFFFIRIVFY